MEHCPICFDDEDIINSEERDISTLPCGHKFCLNCILLWFDTDNKCPLCRRDPVALKKYEEYIKRYKPRNRRTGRRHKVNHRK